MKSNTNIADQPQTKTPKISSLPKRDDSKIMQGGKQIFPRAMYTGSLPCCGGI